MSSAYALPLGRKIKARESSRNSNSTKSLVLSILMISMSLSAVIIEVNQPTWDLEKSPAEFDTSGISEKLSELIMPIANVLWPSDDTGELDSEDSQSSMTGARSSPPILSLSTSSVALIYGENVNPTITPSNSGGTVTSWSISPTLPSGLSFGTGNGTIWGNPTALSGATDYTITGTNSFGSDFVVIEIEVVQESPIIQYSVTSHTFNKNTPISPITPTVFRGTGITWSVSPSLPTGITIDSATGVISGTPASASASAPYTVTASNAGGSDYWFLTDSLQNYDEYRGASILSNHGLKIKWYTATLDVSFTSGSSEITPQSGTWSSGDLENIFSSLTCITA